MAEHQMIYIPTWGATLIALLAFAFGAYLGTISKADNSTSGITSGKTKRESCDQSVPKTSGDSPLGVTPSH